MNIQSLPHIEDIRKGLNLRLLEIQSRLSMWEEVDLKKARAANILDVVEDHLQTLRAAEKRVKEMLQQADNELLI